jgi:F0F1-type ATP synthase membrane subunit a
MKPMNSRRIELMSKFTKKSQLIREKTISELVSGLKYFKEHSRSTIVLTFAIGVFAYWPSVSIKKFGMGEYMKNVGQCMAVTFALIATAERLKNEEDKLCRNKKEKV